MSTNDSATLQDFATTDESDDDCLCDDYELGCFEHYELNEEDA